MQEPGLLVEPLGKHHNRKGFDCGNDELNKWFQRTANQHGRKGLSKTFVAVNPDHPETVVGFFAISGSEIDTKTLPERLRKKLPDKAPAIFLGRLAVSVSHQRQGIGEFLLIDAISHAEQAIEHVAGVGLVVHSKPDAVDFYKRYGFEEMADHPDNLFLRLPMAD